MTENNMSSDGRYNLCGSMDSNLAWYALRTRSNYEKVAAAFLAGRGLEQFLPLYRTRKRWSDRVVENSIPLFPGYLFCRFDQRFRAPILGSLGVVSIVAFGGTPAPIADAEIEAIRTALGSGRLMEPHPYLHEGQQIRIEKGPLRGLEGILVKKRTWRIVITVQLLRRAVAVEIGPDCVTPVGAREGQSQQDVPASTFCSSETFVSNQASSFLRETQESSFVGA